MPYAVKYDYKSKKWLTYNPDTGRVYGAHTSKKKARAQQSVLYIKAPPDKGK